MDLDVNFWALKLFWVLRLRNLLYISMTKKPIIYTWTFSLFLFTHASVLSRLTLHKIALYHCVCTDQRRWKNWKLLCPGQHVSFFAVGGLLIGNKFKQNRLDDSDSYLFTDLHAHPVRHKTLTSRVPQGSRLPLALFSIKLQLLCSEKVKCQQHVHSIHPLWFFCTQPSHL